MPYFLKGNCVHKGTKEEPGKVVKCHEDHAAALAHMQALYANVEDEKGGPGSGWHAPAEGTHTAANAPNFAGGPGADRKYGAEDEPAEGQKHCKCTKCNSTFTLPKGKQCKDVECPGCGGRAEQTSPRKDEPAEGEEGGSGGGRGGKKGVQETHPCTCPQCDKTVHISGNEVQCPDCKVMMKAVTPSGAGAVHGEGSMLGEVSSVMDDGGCKCPHCGKGLPCTAKACPHCKESIDKVDRKEGDSDKSFVSYKSADGSWRWLSISNWAVVDKEAELITEQAYRDAIAYAEKTGKWGELDEVHVDGTDAGDCDMLFILKSGDEPAKFGAGGTWYDMAKATRTREALQAEPDYWGMSLKFRFNPRRKYRGVYTRDIQALKHSILPQSMAASWGTAIAVQGGKMTKQLDEKTAEALLRLGHTEEEIEVLAEKNKALPDEVNVVEKEDTTQETEESPQGLLEKLGKMFKSKETVPVASVPDEAGKAEKVTDPVIAAEPAETKQTTPERDESKQAGDNEDAEALIQALGLTVAKSVGTMVKAELDVQNERIAALEETIKGLSESVEEKVGKALRDVPPAAHVAPSQVDATVADEKVKGLTFQNKPAEASKFYTELLGGIEQVVKEKMAGAKFAL